MTQLSADARFDRITSFDAIHDQRDPAAVLRTAALSPDEIYLVGEPRASSRLVEKVGNSFGPLDVRMSVLRTA